MNIAGSMQDAYSAAGGQAARAGHEGGAQMALQVGMELATNYNAGAADTALWSMGNTPKIYVKESWMRQADLLQA